MKKQILTLALMAMVLAVSAQTKKPVNKINEGTGLSTSKVDTVYMLHEADLSRIYSLLNAGYNGVSTSDNFSVNDRKRYVEGYKRIDSALQPQILRYHPKGKKG